MRLIKGDQSSTIWRVMRGNKRMPLDTWEEYKELGCPEIEVVRERIIMEMRMHLSPQVLVVIPTLERPEMCRRAVLSLLHQTFHNWECYVVKNGKANLIPKYVASLRGFLSEARVRLVQIHEQGLGHAINAGLRHLGEHPFVAVLEDDDEWDKNFLKKMTAAAWETAADVVYCKQRQVPDRKQFEGEPLNRSRMLHRNQINWPMSLFSAPKLKEILPIDNDVGPATDWDTHLRLLTAGAKYHFLNEALVTHYWHSSNYCLQADGKPAIAAKRERGEYYE